MRCGLIWSICCSGSSLLFWAWFSSSNIGGRNRCILAEPRFKKRVQGRAFLLLFLSWLADWRNWRERGGEGRGGEGGGEGTDSNACRQAYGRRRGSINMRLGQKLFPLDGRVGWALNSNTLFCERWFFWIPWPGAKKLRFIYSIYFFFMQDLSMYKYKI